MNNKPYWISDLEIGDRPEVVINKISGDKIELCPEAVAVYDMIKGAELMKEYDVMREGLDYFLEQWPNEYMILLD